ncbi:MAG: PadR family transcriptional regulator [Sulfurimonas sp.]|nr:PadR family transcriptional regulator [Sulfurimonas sp.]MDD3060141.1 PadR family transcriptional regulator [Sulfurimonas sp.]MDD5202769.1 PadR family transcriptional regulator [Sulfurimonas sp.]
MNTKTLCLGILTLGDASGYDIRKQLEENFGHFMDVSTNAVYPALKNLSQENLVTYTIIKQEKYPDKKIYRLTEKGRNVWTKSLQNLSPKHKVRSQLMLLMFFADTLNSERMQEIMIERLNELGHWTNVCNSWQTSDESLNAGIGPHFLVDYAMTMMEAEKEFLEKNANRFVRQSDDGEIEKTS